MPKTYAEGTRTGSRLTGSSRGQPVMRDLHLYPTERIRAVEWQAYRNGCRCCWSCLGHALHVQVCGEGRWGDVKSTGTSRGACVTRCLGLQDRRRHDIPQSSAFPRSRDWAIPMGGSAGKSRRIPETAAPSASCFTGRSRLSVCLRAAYWGVYMCVCVYMCLDGLGRRGGCHSCGLCVRACVCACVCVCVCMYVCFSVVACIRGLGGPVGKACRDSHRQTHRRHRGPHHHPRAAG